MLRFLLCAFLICLCVAVPAQGLFSDTDRRAIITFWNMPNRYKVGIPDRYQNAPWQVRLTPQGSLWFWRYQQVIGAGKAPPTQDPTATVPASNGWKEWVQAKVAFDRWQAQQAANSANLPARPGAVSLPSRGSKSVRQNASGDNATGFAPPPAPGPIPPSLLTAVGNPPAFAAAVTPMQHTVTFDEGDTYSFVDNTAVSPTFAYYRFPQGVGTGGAPLTDQERETLFNTAGLTDTQRKVMMAVSRLEGSFDAINTYDTGYVSVGFIQFITFDDGRHSLCNVLVREKTDAPADFEKDFRHFGVDVTPENVIVVVDPATGAELIGPEAVRKIVDDKRLIAIFQRAGRTSTPFRVAQIQVAKTNYWPEDDPIAISINGQTLTGKVSDVVHSEAGLATLFDRKVNRGSVAPLTDVVAGVMTKYKLKNVPDAARYEQEIVAACKYRTDFLKDLSLGQPKSANE